MISATMIFLIILPFVIKFKNQPWKSRTFTYYCRAFLYSWGSRIRYHGKKARLDEPHIFVSNHTSFIDYIVLSADSFVHSTVAQKHGGIIGWFETSILTLVGSLTFDRTSKGERKDVLPKIRSHISNPKCAPLLVFPEGTCVNNDYTVLFHKGIFELDCVIVPVAIKYNKKWADAYWHTKTQTFSKHLFYLMTRWALIADVWYLPPRARRPDQTASQFAAEIKAEISNVAELKNLSWDGYYKNFILLRDKRASLRASPQSIYLNSLLKRINNNVKSSEKSEFNRLTYRSPTKVKTPTSDNSTKKEPSGKTAFQAEDPIVTRNQFLVEMGNSCNLSVIQSYSSRQAGLLDAFESYAKSDSNMHYVKVRTDNIAQRSWFKKKLTVLVNKMNPEAGMENRTTPQDNSEST